MYDSSLVNYYIFIFQSYLALICLIAFGAITQISATQRWNTRAAATNNQNNLNRPKRQEVPEPGFPAAAPARALDDVPEEVTDETADDSEAAVDEDEALPVGVAKNRVKSLLIKKAKNTNKPRTSQNIKMCL